MKHLCPNSRAADDRGRVDGVWVRGRRQRTRRVQERAVEFVPEKLWLRKSSMVAGRHLGDSNRMNQLPTDWEASRRYWDEKQIPCDPNR